MTALVIRGDAHRLPIADSTVDLVVTSPPYFALRSYTDDGKHYAGQIGDEPSPADYLDALLAVTAECVRVLRPEGSLWINLGDKYAERTGPARRGGIDDDPTISRPADRPARGRRGSVPVKSLMGLPWRYAIRAVDDLGLILRAEVVWDKPNGIPGSAVDRVQRTHETWFHLTTRARYYADLSGIRTPHSPATISRAKYRTDKAMNGRMQGTPGELRAKANPWQPSSGGVVPGSVWRIATANLDVPDSLDVEDHYATFPPEWPRRLIMAWSPPGGVVLDPFSGSGTTIHVAAALGRVGIGVDLSHSYCRLAANERVARLRFAQVHDLAKPREVAPDQEALW